MTTAINRSQTTPTWQGPLQGTFSRDNHGLAERQSSTFEQLLAGFEWKPLEVSSEPVENGESGEEVSELEQSNETESTKEDDKSEVESTEAETAVTEEVLLQSEVVATVQVAQKVETAREDGPVKKDFAESEVEVEVGAIDPKQSVINQAVVTEENDAPLELEQTETDIIPEQKLQVESQVHEHRDTGPKEDKGRKNTNRDKVGPVVAQSQQQVKVEAKSEVKVEAKKEVKVSAQEEIEAAPTQSLEELRPNRRSRKERLAENAENRGQDNVKQGFPDDPSEVNAGQKPDVSVKPPEQPFSLPPTEAANATPQVIAPTVPANNPTSSTNTEVRGGDRLQGVGGVGANNSNSVRGEARSESASRTDDSKKGREANKAEEKSPVDQRQQIRLIQRVARGFERIGDQGGNIRLRLHPPELGSLAMTVRVEGKTLSAEIVTETVQARQALVDNLPQLKQQLADSGLTIEKFDVRVMDQQQNSSGQMFSQGQFAGQNSSNEPSGRGNHSSNRRDASNQIRRPSVGNTTESVMGWPTPGSRSPASRSLDVQV